MGNGAGDPKPVDAGSAVSRRAFVRRGTVTGTGAFVVPMIVTVDPADPQALTSPPPEPPGSSHGSPGAETPTTTAASPTSSHVSGRTELPRTGGDIDRLVAAGLAAAGLAATARGAALVLWSADIKSKSSAPTSTDPEPET
jgi:hypothetical protein